MKQSTGERETFVVRILNTQNATWQGTVTWTDGRRTEPFRSALELIRLIDSTLLERLCRQARPAATMFHSF